VFCSCDSEAAEYTFDAAAGISVCTSVATGNAGDADSARSETAAEAARPPATVSDSSSIAGHDVLAGILLRRSFSAFSASCLLYEQGHYSQTKPKTPV